MPPDLLMDDTLLMLGGNKSSATGTALTGRRRQPNLAAIYGARRGLTDSQLPLNDSNDSSLGGNGGTGFVNGAGFANNGAGTAAAVNNGFRSSGEAGTAAGGSTAAAPG